MKVLIIGGTRFSGRNATELALERGHDVTLFHRGITGPGLFPQATHVIGDRDTDLEKLSGGSWDATIDFSAYTPLHVRELAGALGARGGHYTFISSTAAYATNASAHGQPASGATEDAPLAEADRPLPTHFSMSDPAAIAAYGMLKVASERAAREAFGRGVLIVRPTYIIGPLDYTGRFTYWVKRIARGGEVLAPGPREPTLQVVDARDVAAFAIDNSERATDGTFHLTTPQPPARWGDLLDTVAATVAPAGTRLTWVDRDFLLSRGQNSATLPLWPSGGPYEDGFALDNSAAVRAGFTPRPVAESVRDIAEAERGVASTEADARADRRDAEILAAWRAR
jgi:2'-hydroxyisoflavone reductase